MVSGGTNGTVKAWKTNDLEEHMNPIFEFPAHNGIFFLSVLMVDCVSSAVLHPSWPILATCSGSHHFEVDDDEDEVEEERDYSLKVWVFD